MESKEFIELAVKMGYATESQARQYVNSRRTKKFSDKDLISLHRRMPRFGRGRAISLNMPDKVRLEKRCNNRDYYIRDDRMRLVFNPQYLRWI